MNRDEVYNQVNKERDYQITKWGVNHDSNQSIADFILTIECLLQDAKLALGKGSYSLPALTSLRKLTAVGVASLEKFGCPPRS